MDFGQQMIVAVCWGEMNFSLQKENCWIEDVSVVKDAVVVKSSSKIFEEAALKSILRWRYNPKIEGGVAVDRVGVQTIIRFTLEN